jgi:cell division protein DivIC
MNSKTNKRTITPLNETYIIKHELKQKHEAKKRKLLYRRLSVFFVMVSIVSYFLINTLISQSKTIKAKQEELSQLETKFSELQKQQKLLEEEIIKLNDDEYIGKLARKEYYLSDENEIIFTIPEENDKNKDKKKEKGDSH